MALALPGISNENSFFSEHYLTALFEKHRREWECRVDLDAGTVPQLRQLQRLFHRSRYAHTRVQQASTLPMAAGEFQHALLTTLGYDRHRTTQVVTLQGQAVAVPVLARIGRSEAEDALWILEAREAGGENAWGQDPLALSYDPVLYPATDLPLPSGTLREVIETGIYGQRRPPRWVLVMSLAEVVLLDRYKWAEDRLLRFDLETVLASPASSWHALRALLHRKSLVPEGETRGMEWFDEESRRHAQGVSGDLKHAMREGVELLGNEAAAQWGTADLNAEQLTRECLRYLYRLLFLFYAESHPEQVQHEAMRSPEYQAGYSLETLRDVEMMQLWGEEDTWFLRDGTPYQRNKHSILHRDITHHDFVLEPVGADLFAPDSLTLLEEIRIPDRVLRRIIELLSLSQAGKRGRGRISYAQLGVNQLGSVYETLLSYTGFFAREDLVEVKRAQDDVPDVLDRTWFVPRSQSEAYAQEEIVYDGAEPRVVAKGHFVYCWTGYEREATASLYTPESLTRSTVKYALRELLQDCPADRILQLRICEPAMGSAAFLIEAVNQLADAYLKRKQQELGGHIDLHAVPLERQRVRAYITARNAFGVDINPVAQELGEISLWLNCMEPGGFRPDFSHTLYLGNSLVGARREVVTFKKEKKGYQVQAGNLRRLGFDEQRQAHEIFHFLVPVREMAELKVKEIKTLVPAAPASVQAWRQDVRRPYKEWEFQALQYMSEAIDYLWQEAAKERTSRRKENEQTFPAIYGQRQPNAARDKDSYVVGDSEAYDRLQRAMDYWCSLWFWPLEGLAALPTRAQFLAEMSLILTGHGAALTGTPDWVQQAQLEDVASEAIRTLLERPGEFIRVAELDQVMPERHPIIEQLATRERFFHWELAFADIFTASGGFDLIVGNPPWIKLDWSEKYALAQYDPQIVVRKLSADQIARRKPRILDTAAKQAEFLEGYRHATGYAAYAGHRWNYPLLGRIQPNTYKMFLVRTFQWVGNSGSIGLVHPVDHLKDPKGQAFRGACYPRLRWLFQFANERARHMFGDVHSRITYAIGIYTGRKEEIRFGLIANLYAPDTIEECFHHDGAGPIPGIKDDAGHWQLRGHRGRIIEVDEATLGRLGRI